jgi:hypothetical protein
MYQYLLGRLRLRHKKTRRGPPAALTWSGVLQEKNDSEDVQLSKVNITYDEFESLAVPSRRARHR